MFRFEREKILPIFLERRITVADLSRLAKTSHAAAWRAINGEAVGATVVSRIADALGITAADTPKFLVRPSAPVVF